MNHRDDDHLIIYLSAQPFKYLPEGPPFSETETETDFNSVP